MRTTTRALSLGLLATALALGAAPAAEARGHWGGHGSHGGYWGPGLFLGGMGLGLGLGYYASYPAYAYSPGYVVVQQPPPPVYYATPSVPSAPAVSSAPEPIFYPRNGQSAAQTEADRQECNRWATTQPSAMGNASVFQRATLACMDGRGYTGR